MKESLEKICLIVLLTCLILCIISAVNSFKTLDYMKYSDYVLNDWLLQQDSNYRVENVENFVEK